MIPLPWIWRLRRVAPITPRFHSLDVASELRVFNRIADGQLRIGHRQVIAGLSPAVEADGGQHEGGVGFYMARVAVFVVGPHLLDELSQVGLVAVGGISVLTVPVPLKPDEAADLETLRRPLRVLGGEVVQHVGHVEDRVNIPTSRGLRADPRLRVRAGGVGNLANVGYPVVVDLAACGISRGVHPVGGPHVVLGQKKIVVLLASIPVEGRRTAAIGRPTVGRLPVTGIGAAVVVIARAARRQDVPKKAAVALGGLDDQHRFAVVISHDMTEAQFRAELGRGRTLAWG